MAAVFQGLATRNVPARRGVDPTLLLSLLAQPLFLVAVVLNLLGFTLHVTALQSLPLFLVQAVISSSVAVTAVMSVRLFHAPLSGRQWLSVGAVIAGIAILAPTAESAADVEVTGLAQLTLFVTLVLVVVLSVGAGRLAPASAAVTLGLLAGAGFGIVALSARLLPAHVTASSLLSSPSTYLLLAAGATAFLLYSTAMQRGTVTTTTAALVITQTGVPALVGALLLGDRVRSGLLPVAVAGFALAVGGALGLARFEAGAPADRSGVAGG